MQRFRTFPRHPALLFAPPTRRRARCVQGDPPLLPGGSSSPWSQRDASAPAKFAGYARLIQTYPTTSTETAGIPKGRLARGSSTGESKSPFRHQPIGSKPSFRPTYREIATAYLRNFLPMERLHHLPFCASEKRSFVNQRAASGFVR